MSTSQNPSILSEIVEGKPIPLSTLVYFRAFLRNRFHSLVLREFLKQSREKGLTQKDLAERIGRKPEQVHRWLSAAGNWTFDSLSDLMVGLGVELPRDLTFGHLSDRLATVAKSEQPTKVEITLKRFKSFLENCAPSPYLERFVRDPVIDASGIPTTAIKSSTAIGGSVSQTVERIQKQAQRGPTKVHDLTERLKTRSGQSQNVSRRLGVG